MFGSKSKKKLKHSHLYAPRSSEARRAKAGISYYETHYGRLAKSGGRGEEASVPSLQSDHERFLSRNFTRPPSYVADTNDPLVLKAANNSAVAPASSTASLVVGQSEPVPATSPPPSPSLQTPLHPSVQGLAPTGSTRTPSFSLSSTAPLDTAHGCRSELPTRSLQVQQRRAGSTPLLYSVTPPTHQTPAAPSFSQGAQPQQASSSSPLSSQHAVPAQASSFASNPYRKQQTGRYAGYVVNPQQQYHSTTSSIATAAANALPSSPSIAARISSEGSAYPMASPPVQTSQTPCPGKAVLRTPAQQNQSFHSGTEQSQQLLHASSQNPLYAPVSHSQLSYPATQALPPQSHQFYLDSQHSIHSMPQSTAMCPPTHIPPEMVRSHPSYDESQPQIYSSDQHSPLATYSDSAVPRQQVPSRTPTGFSKPPPSLSPPSLQQRAKSTAPTLSSDSAHFSASSFRSQPNDLQKVSPSYYSPLKSQHLSNSSGPFPSVVSFSESKSVNSEQLATSTHVSVAANEASISKACLPPRTPTAEYTVPKDNLAYDSLYPARQQIGCSKEQVAVDVKAASKPQTCSVTPLSKPLLQPSSTTQRGADASQSPALIDHSTPAAHVSSHDDSFNPREEAPGSSTVVATSNSVIDEPDKVQSASVSVMSSSKPLPTIPASGSKPLPTPPKPLPSPPVTKKSSSHIETSNYTAPIREGMQQQVVESEQLKALEGERLKLEAERKQMEDLLQQRAKEEKEKLLKEQQRIELERKRIEEERKRNEEERKAIQKEQNELERKKMEEALRKKELQQEQRRIEEERIRVEQQRKRDEEERERIFKEQEELRRLEAERKALEDTLQRIEKEQLQHEEERQTILIQKELELELRLKEEREKIEAEKARLESARKTLEEKRQLQEAELLTRAGSLLEMVESSAPPPPGPAEECASKQVQKEQVPTTSLETTAAAEANTDMMNAAKKKDSIHEASQHSLDTLAAHPIPQGWLHCGIRMGGKMFAKEKWGKYYFVLKGKELKFYDEPPPWPWTIPNGVIDLTAVTGLTTPRDEPKYDKKKKMNYFEIMAATNKRFRLAWSEQEEIDRWVAILNSCLLSSTRRSKKAVKVVSLNPEDD